MHPHTRTRTRTPATKTSAILALLAAALLTSCGGGGGGAGGGGDDPPAPPPGNDVTPPTVTLAAPTGRVALIPGDDLAVVFTADDDANAEVRVLLDDDGDPLTTADQVVLFTGTDQNGTQVALELDTSPAGAGHYELFVVVDDQSNPAVVSSSATVLFYEGLAGVSPPRANRYGVTGESVVFSVGEAEQGGTDLDADGDVGDGVVSVLDTAAGTRDQTGLSIDVSPVGLVATAQVLPSEVGGILWHRREPDEGRVLNADGDMLDVVVAYVAPLLGVGPTTVPVGGALLTRGGVPGKRVIRVSEPAHGADLNGDGDTLDEVVRVLDLSLNTVAGAGPQLRAGAPYVSSGKYGTYLCDEMTEGPLNAGQDLNGDNDTFDTLVAAVDAASGSVTWVSTSNADPASAIGAPARTPISPIAGFYVDEGLASPGAPLNGDGDWSDFVPALGTGPEAFPAGAPLNAGSGARYVFCAGLTVVYLAAEEPGFDYNNDGDFLDTETLHWVRAAGASTWAPLGPGIGSLQSLALDGGFGALVTPEWLGLAVTESANGTIFNGDGDLLDSVFMLVDLSGGTPVVHNTGIVPASPATLPLPGATIPVTGVGGDSGVVVLAAETANGDLNADGDATDVLLVYFDFSAPTTPVVLPDTGAMHATISSGLIATTAYEALALTDLNGDGDTSDFLFRCFDPSGAVVEAGLLCDPNSVPATGLGKIWAYLRSESAEQRFLNPDGDMTDVVLGIWLR